MVRSPAFGSTACNSNRTFCTRFRFGSGTESLNLAARNNSRAHYAKGTRSGIPLAGHSPPTACRYMVSGSFHSPNRGSFHHFRSRYWFAIGRQGVLSLRRWTARIQTSFHGTGLTWEMTSEVSRLFAYGAITRCGRTFQVASAKTDICNFRPPPQREDSHSLDPGYATVAALHVTGLGSFPFARRY